MSDSSSQALPERGMGTAARARVDLVDPVAVMGGVQAVRDRNDCPPLDGPTRASARGG